MYLQPSYVKGMTPDLWGLINTPHGSMAVRHLEVYRWAADNQAFTGQFDERTFFDWLERMLPYQATNLFVAVPDVVGDCAETLRRFEHYAPRVRELGYKVALVAQDGLEHVKNWPSFDWLFIGGSDDWKESFGMGRCCARAIALGCDDHYGRCNSKRRFDLAQLLGCSTADGTFVKFGGQANWRRMRHWPAQMPLLRLES